MNTIEHTEASRTAAENETYEPTAAEIAWLRDTIEADAEVQASGAW